jgi:hypothetical protein
LHAQRNFFGVIRVVNDPTRGVHSFLHGSTVHGRQSTASERRCEPLSYYHQDGPLGKIFAQIERTRPQANVGIIGLGIGGTAAYARADQHWTFYEINPAVVSVARTSQYFSYLNDCSKAPTNIVLGDARLQLHSAPDNAYDVLVLDAFSSDAIPIHLVTQQALDLYLSKVAPGGLIVFHISNRNLDLSQVVADLAQSRQLSCLSMRDRSQPQVDGRDPSHWMVLARNTGDFGGLVNESYARPLTGSGARNVWTDDFSNIITVFKWNADE